MSNEMSDYGNISNDTNWDDGINVAIPIIKFLCGLITITLFIVVLFGITLCKCLAFSSKTLLITFYLLNIISYLLMTFYSPFVSLGYISLENHIVIKIVAVFYQFSAFGLHIVQSVVSVDRLVALRFKPRRKVLFSEKRTKILILCIILYASVLASSTFMYCCTIVYDPTLPGWYYPYDEETHYRQYFSISLNGNGVFILTVYCYLMYFIHNKKRQIMNQEVQRRLIEKELGLCIIFIFPLIVGTFYSATNIIIQLFPKFAKQSFTFHFAELTRYTYFFEPILTICILKEVRNVLKRKLCRKAKSVVAPVKNDKFTKNTCQEVVAVNRFELHSI